VAHGKAALGAAAFAALWLGAPTAGAFCRTTTCDAADPAGDCSFDAHGCSTQGIPLAWPTQCISFGVQADGSPLRHITHQTFERIIQTAFTQWTATQCGGARPSFKIWDLGNIECGEAEFNKAAPNANTWMFRDKDWPYVGVASTLALTTITFELKKGTILDADVEVNSFATPLTTSDEAPGHDLQAIATHEAGHFLGLAHSSIADATMNQGYTPGDLSFRTLADDDQAAICTAYPPGRTTGTCSGPTPLNGFSRSCAADNPSSTKSGLSGKDAGTSGGCSVGSAAAWRRRGLSPWASLALSALVLARARRRRSAR
jgi:hypothetical protein